MKKIIVVLLAVLALSSCAPVQIKEGRSGISTTHETVFAGDCALDHFDRYFACAVQRAGGSDE